MRASFVTILSERNTGHKSYESPRMLAIFPTNGNLDQLHIFHQYPNILYKYPSVSFIAFADYGGSVQISLVLNSHSIHLLYVALTHETVNRTTEQANCTRQYRREIILAIRSVSGLYVTARNHSDDRRHCSSIRSQGGMEVAPR